LTCTRRGYFIDLDEIIQWSAMTYQWFHISQQQYYNFPYLRHTISTRSFDKLCWLDVHKSLYEGTDHYPGLQGRLLCCNLCTDALELINTQYDL
jgi:hypothetical protein